MSDVGTLIYLPRRLRMAVVLLLASSLAGAVWLICHAIFGRALAVVLFQSRRDMAFGSRRHWGHEAKRPFRAQECPDAHSDAAHSFSANEPGHDALQGSAARFPRAPDIARMTRAVARTALRSRLPAAGVP